MAKDANVTQVSELRVFAQASSNYGREMAHLCRLGINESDEAYRAADYLFNMVRRKVEDAQRTLYRAKSALSKYESQNHTDKDGNSTYDYSYAAKLRAEVEKARQELNAAREDEQQVQSRYLEVRNEIESLKSELSSASNVVDSNGGNVYRQVSRAASILETEYNINH